MTVIGNSTPPAMTVIENGTSRHDRHRKRHVPAMQFVVTVPNVAVIAPFNGSPQ